MRPAPPGCAVGRKHPVPSSCALRRAGQLGLEIGQHAMIRVAGPLPLAPLYFIDNVTTTGNTLYAARAADMKTSGYEVRTVPAPRTLADLFSGGKLSMSSPIAPKIEISR